MASGGDKDSSAQHEEPSGPQTAEDMSSNAQDVKYEAEAPPVWTFLSFAAVGLVNSVLRFFLWQGHLGMTASDLGVLAQRSQASWDHCVALPLNPMMIQTLATMPGAEDAFHRRA